MRTQTKKVLFTSHTANFSKFNRPFMRWFKEQGYEVHYASASEEEVLDCDKHFAIPFERSPFRINNLKSIRLLKKIIDAEDYDIIHTHTPMGSVITRIAAISTRKNGTRVIYTAHGFHFFKGAPLLNWLIFYPIEKILANYTDTLITINKEDYELAKRKFKTDVRYVPGVGIDPKKFDFKMTKQQKTDLRKSLGLKDSDFVMIYPAELNKNKNQLWLIKSLANLMQNNNKFHLLLAGRDNLEGRCQKLVNELAIKNSVHFLGYRKDIPQLLNISNIAVSSSLREGLPVNIMEAMYVGLPIIVTGCRGNKDLIKNGENGFVIPQHDSLLLLQNIEQLYNSKHSCLKLSTEAKKIVVPYTLDKIIDQMADIYRRDNRPVILHLLASNKYSGAENIACTIIEGTDSELYRSIYCSPNGEISKNLSARGIEFVSIAKLNRRNLKIITKALNVKYIHAHDFRASILASSFTKKIIVISHIHQNPYWLGSVSIKSILYKSVSKKFSKIIVVSEAIKNNKTFSAIAKTTPVEVLYNKVSKQHIVALSRNDNTPHYDISFFGRLVAFKQPLDFVKIVSLIKINQSNVRAAIVGDGPLMPDVISMIHEKKLAKNIDIIGYTNNPYTYMKNSRFSVMCSNNDEGFGLVNVEATILNTVVIAYNITNLKEIFKDSITLAESTQDVVRIYSDLSISPQKYSHALAYNKSVLSKFIRTSKDNKEFINIYTIKGNN